VADELLTDAQALEALRRDPEATKTVGLVSAIGSTVLFAMRFDKTNARRLIDYLHQGHGSTYVDATNYAPAGFPSGSHTETLWTWLALIGGFLAVVAVAAFFEQWLRGSRT
jgi:hypothetical protein